ncbi:hypothetical protein ACOMHN_034385 [Nucella lapillus]
MLASEASEPKEILPLPQTDLLEDEDSLSHSDIFRLRSCLAEIVEDLKLRKTVEKDNEERISQLLCEKHEMERSLDSEKQSQQRQEEKHQQEMMQTKQQCEEKLKSLEDEQRQFQILKNCAEKDMAALREEARVLQMSQYRAEKRMKELESKVGRQDQRSETHLGQVTGLEHKVSAVKVHCRRLEGSQSRLDRNG